MDGMDFSHIFQWEPPSILAMEREILPEIRVGYIEPAPRSRKNPTPNSCPNLSLSLSLSLSLCLCLSPFRGFFLRRARLLSLSYTPIPEGKVVPVIVVGFREGNIVTQVKTVSTDGYDAIQVGYRRVRDKKLTKPEIGHLDKIGAIPMRHLQEFRLQSIEGFEPNQRLVLEEIFKEGDLVDVSGNSIGKGFQGFS